MDNFPLMNSCLPTLLLCLVYVMIVKVWGPSYMKDRPPYKLFWVLVVYNLVQIGISAYLFYEVSLIKPLFFSFPRVHVLIVIIYSNRGL